MATHDNSDARSISNEKLDAVHIENGAVEQNGICSPEEVQGRYPLLRDLNKDQMAALNKKVLRKLDWRLMPTITIMFLLK